MSEALPLFPLRSVLLPTGRMPLQLFEPRYLDLVSRCMKNGTGFGIVHITSGSEVVLVQGAEPPGIAQIGTLARIVDWDAMPQGRLRITVEGSRRFRVLASRTAADYLLHGEIEWLEDAPAAPLGDEHLHLQDIMAGLAEHPALARMGVSASDLDSRELGYALAQYLPLDEADRYALLLEENALQGLEYIESIVRELAGGSG